MKLGDDIDFTKLKAGKKYTVTQEKLSGWKLKRIVCDVDPRATWKVNLKKRTVTIEFDVRGARASCTFVDKRA